ncbi:hypothetical protein [Winogradskya consettensis]|nr:hypothetical protein [Actinoplanes consettensis]
MRPESGPVDAGARPAGWRRAGVLGRLDTPGRLMVAVGVVVLLLGALAGVTVVSPRAAEALGQDAAAASASNSASARDIYQGIADTDAAASVLFLATSLAQRDALMGLYVEAVDRAQSALSAAMVRAYDDPARLARLTTIADEVRAYRKVVDDGLTVGLGDDFAKQAVLASAYAREASFYISDVVLPSVMRLGTEDQERLARAQRDGQLWRIAALGLPVLVLLVLGGVQWWLWRRTRRRLNAGLVAAVAAVVVVLGLLVSSWSHYAAAEVGFTALASRMDSEGATQQQLGALLSGRADVSLALGASVDPVKHHQDFLARDLCGSAAGQVNCTALTPVWTARQSGVAGDYDAAVDLVLPGGNVETAFASAREQISDRLDQGERDVDAAVQWLPATPVQHRLLMPALLLVAALAAVAGLWARLSEYS